MRERERESFSFLSVSCATVAAVRVEAAGSLTLYRAEGRTGTRGSYLLLFLLCEVKCEK